MFANENIKKGDHILIEKPLFKETDEKININNYKFYERNLSIETKNKIYNLQDIHSNDSNSKTFFGIMYTNRIACGVNSLNAAI